jgi:two-component system OmpR family sensor kinase
MKLRSRLAIAFVATAVLTVALAYAVTITAFQNAQERQLDSELLTSAREGAADVAARGTLPAAEQFPDESSLTLHGMVVLYALYQRDGTVQVTTPNFDSPPPLRTLRHSPDQPLPLTRLEFSYRGDRLRGVLVRVDTATGPNQRLLLLATSRRDLDKDTLRLVELMGVVLLSALLLAILVGTLLGRWLSQDIERVAAVAERVSRGELSARVNTVAPLASSEIHGLARSLNTMVERLSELISAERRFISYAAHELRSPLTGLKGELELALRRPRTVEGYQASLRAALHDTQRLITMAEDLLTMARLQVSDAPAAPVDVELRSLVDDAVRDSRARITSDVHVQIAVPELRLRARPHDLSRLLRNLLDNALIHAPQDSAVRITARATTDSRGAAAIELAVEDRGVGVAVEFRERLFEPFFRGEAERENSGAGLGLCIAREIAIAHGGELFLDTAYGPGARFVATLPTGISAAASAHR